MNDGGREGVEVVDSLGNMKKDIKSNEKGWESGD